MIKIDHYDDKKESPKSHMVKFTDEQMEQLRARLYRESLFTCDVPFIIGYGANKEEALQDFLTQIDSYYKFICDIKKELDMNMNLSELK